MERNYEEILFNFINSYGPVFSDKMAIIDNTGPLAEGKFYRVFLKGGIQFEICKDEGEYDFIPHWEGPFDCIKPREVIAAMLILGYSVYPTIAS
jgi:hypothetical protein